MTRIDGTLRRLRALVAASRAESPEDGGGGDALKKTARELSDTRRHLWELSCGQLLQASAGFVLDRPVAGRAALRFAWPDGAAARVVEDSDRSGRAAQTTYTARLSRPTRSGIRRLEINGFDILKVGGVDATTPAMRLQLGRARTIGAQLPVLSIDSEGRNRGIEDEDAFYARMERDFEQPLGPKERAASRHLHPKMWLAWVETWLGLPVADEAARREVRVRHRLAGGAHFVGTAKWRSRLVPELSGARWMTLDASLAAVAARRKLRAALAVMSPAIPADELLPAQFRVDLRLDVVCDMETMRPYFVTRLASARLLGRARPIAERHVQEWTFDWDDEG